LFAVLIFKPGFGPPFYDYWVNCAHDVLEHGNFIRGKHQFELTLFLDIIAAEELSEALFKV
jgi:hypothetical protein